MSDEKQFWWCGWTVDHIVPYSEIVESWPRCMLGWCTGDGAKASTWVGLVWAESAEQAMEIVRGCYQEYADMIGERWTPEAKGEGWTPGDRFSITSAQVAALKVRGER